MTRGGIFGISLSGKTTLSKHISALYASRYKIPSLVLDPNSEAYGPHATVTSDEASFWETVWKNKNCLVIVDEAAETINSEKDLIPVFTRMRHLGHKLLVIGHRATNLLPIMREQFDILYLFRQPSKSADIWADLFADDRLKESASLAMYEYMYCRLFREPQKLKTTPFNGQNHFV